MAQPASPRRAGAPSVAVPEEFSPHVGALLNVPGWGVALLDRAGRAGWVNDTLCALSGLPPSAYGRSPLVELWPGLAGALAPLLARALAGEALLDASLVGPLGPGASAPLHLRATLLPAIAGGMTCGLTLVLRDETAQVRQALVRQEREALLSGLSEVACDGYLFHQEGRILEASSALAHLLGTTPEAMKGEPLLRWVAPESRASVQELLRRVVDSPYELLGLRQDGQRLHLEVLAREAPALGPGARLLAVWDISARKASDEVAARTAHFCQHFLGALGHELRTPLYSIQLSAAALQRAEMGEGALRQVAGVVQSARRMERMIRELVDFTRARLAGGLVLQPAPVELDAVASRVVEEHRLAWPSRPLQASVQGDMRGLWDEARLGQVLDNLLANALQHSPVDSAVEVRLEGTAEGVTVSVLNQGPPLPPDEHAVLFEPFRRGRRAQGDGLGLGLYLARQIVLAHAGRLSVESGFGRGTRFSVWLPREAPGAL